ncbi:unnamed protein product, partial [Phaeothamnion confervicola]
AAGGGGGQEGGKAATGRRAAPLRGQWRRGRGRLWRRCLRYRGINPGFHGGGGAGAAAGGDGTGAAGGGGDGGSIFCSLPANPPQAHNMRLSCQFPAGRSVGSSAPGANTSRSTSRRAAPS